MTQLNTRHEPTNPLHDTPTQAAVRAHDRAVRFLDATWGVDVVEELVAPELAARWARAKQLRDEALIADDDDQIVAALETCVRGMKALHEAALADGHKPLDVKATEFRDEKGQRYLFTLDEADARAAARNSRYEGWQIWSLPEVTRLINSKLFDQLMLAKKAFPEAIVVRTGPSTRFNDDLPSNMS